MNEIEFLNIDCEIVMQKYPANGQLAIGLIARDTEHNTVERNMHPGEPVTEATSCLVNASFEEDETAIKNYSENQGVLDVLLDAGIVELTGKTIENGYASFPVVRVLQ